MTPCRLRFAIVSLVALVVVVAASGCGSGGAQNPPAAAPPPGSSQGTDRLASGFLYRFDMTSPANDNFAVTTREVYLYFRPDTTAVHFQLENRLGVPIRILWDEGTFIDTEFRTFKAVHKGVRYDNRLLPQDPTWVQPGMKHIDFLVPVDLLNDPAAAGGQGMRQLFPTDISAQALVGKSFGVKLVIEVENQQRIEFPARFRIASVYPAR